MKTIAPATTKTAQERSKAMRDRAKTIGLTTEAFVAGTFTTAQLQAYLAVVAPFEDHSDLAKKALWDEALIKNKEMMETDGQKPIVIQPE